MIGGWGLSPDPCRSSLSGAPPCLGRAPRRRPDLTSLAQHPPPPLPHQAGSITDLNNSKTSDKRCVLRSQSRDTNRNMKRLVYCQYG